MQHVRYSFFSTNGFLKWLGKAENKEEAMAASLAYLTLREEGRIQISGEQIEARVTMVRRVAKAWPQIHGTGHHQMVPLTVFESPGPDGNPLAKS